MERLTALGDQGALAYFEREADAFGFAAAVRAAAPVWLIDVVQAYASVAVFFDPDQVDYATVAAYPGRDEELCVSGTAGTALLRGADLVHYPAPDAEPEVLVADPAASTAVDPSAMPTAWHRALLEDAVDAFAARRAPLANGPSALVSQRVVAAMYESARTDRWVEVGASPEPARR